MRASAVRALLKLGVVEALVEAGSMTSRELAQAVQFDNPELIGRLLRCLIAEGTVTTDNGSVFCSTPYLTAYISTSGDK